MNNVKRRIKSDYLPCRYDFRVVENGKPFTLYDLTMDELTCLMDVYFRNGYEQVYARIASTWE